MNEWIGNLQSVDSAHHLPLQLWQTISTLLFKLVRGPWRKNYLPFEGSIGFPARQIRATIAIEDKSDC